MDMTHRNPERPFDTPYSYEFMRSMDNKICWHMNDLCNLRCEYCFFDYFDKENPHVGRLSPQEIYEAFKKTGRKWHLFLGGGEPFLYPRFNELINLLQQDHGIQISTNLFNKNVKSFAEEVKPDNIFVINASLHIAIHNEKSLAKFIQNYHLLKNKGFEIMVSYVTYPPLFERMRDDFKYLKSQGITEVHPLTFQGEYEGKRYPGSYTKDELLTIKELTLEQGELFVAADSMNFQGSMCRAGQEYFYLETDGEMFKCASVRESCGNLFDGTFVAGSKPMKCPVGNCNDSCLGITSLIERPALPKIGQTDSSSFITKNIKRLQSLYK